MITDAEHAAVLRHLEERGLLITPNEFAAIERAIELLEREARMDATVREAIAWRDASDDGIVT